MSGMAAPDESWCLIGSNLSFEIGLWSVPVTVPYRVIVQRWFVRRRLVGGLDECRVPMSNMVVFGSNVEIAWACINIPDVVHKLFGSSKSFAPLCSMVCVAGVPDSVPFGPFVCSAPIISLLRVAGILDSVPLFP